MLMLNAELVAAEAEERREAAAVRAANLKIQLRKEKIETSSNSAVSWRSRTSRGVPSLETGKAKDERDAMSQAGSSQPSHSDWIPNCSVQT
jgi:hypothetical protein